MNKILREFSLKLTKSVCRLLTLVGDDCDPTIAESLMKSAGTIGMKLSEAEHPLDQKEFKRDMYTVLKELEKIEYWTILLEMIDVVTEKGVEQIVSPCEEIKSVVEVFMNDIAKEAV